MHVAAIEPARIEAKRRLDAGDCCFGLAGEGLAPGNLVYGGELRKAA